MGSSEQNVSSRLLCPWAAAAPQGLCDAAEDACAKSIIMPVSVSVTGYFGHAPDTVMAMPVPAWETLVAALNPASRQDA